jgi:hypothetical protein
MKIAQEVVSQQCTVGIPTRNAFQGSGDSEQNFGKLEGPFSV